MLPYSETLKLILRMCCMGDIVLKGFILTLITVYCIWSIYCEYRVIKEIGTRTKRKQLIGDDNDPIHPKVYFYLFWGGPVTWLLTFLLYKFLCIFNKTKKG